MLTVDKLRLSIDDHLLCEALSFSLAWGKSLAILGRNGAGKTTLLSTLAGLRPLQGGSISLDGMLIGDYPPRELAVLRAYCSQQQHDAFPATVLETALLGRHPHLGRWGWESEQDHLLARMALQQTGLTALAARDVRTLSGGERQRLALATVLTQAPKLYLLDEPLAHLDLSHAMQMLDLFCAQAEMQRSVIAVLHDPNLARRHFDDALLLFGDGSWACGAAHDIINQDNLQRLYGHPLRQLDSAGVPWFIPEPT